MSKQQTAVEWLVEQMTPYWLLEKRKANEFIEQARHIEKEQIKNAHVIGLITSIETEAHNQAEDYYNETYGKK